MMHQEPENNTRLRVIIMNSTDICQDLQARYLQLTLAE